MVSNVFQDLNSIDKSECVANFRFDSLFDYGNFLALNAYRPGLLQFLRQFRQ